MVLETFLNRVDSFDVAGRRAAMETLLIQKTDRQKNIASKLDLVNSEVKLLNKLLKKGV